MPTGSEVRWALTIKGNPHLLVAGLPGMGKTTCLLNLCKQMLDAGVRPIVFSYHQDIDEGLERLVATMRFLDFRGLGFNPLQVMDRKSPMAYLDVAGALRDIFVAIYPELGDIQGERIRKAIKESFIEHGWDDARGFVERGDFDKAIEIYKYILVRYGDDAVAVEYAHAYLGDIFLTLQNLDLAENHIKKAIDCKPENPGYHYILGFVYSYKRQWALQAFLGQYPPSLN